MITRTAALLGLALLPALPAAAQDDFDLDALLAQIPVVAGMLLDDPERDNRFGGALAACMIGATDPQAAIGALEAAGWNPMEGADGTLGFDFDGTFAETVTVALEPGFCMVESTSYGTAEALQILVLMAEALEIPRFELSPGSAGECAYAEMALGISAQLSGEGNDPACTSETGSAIRFAIVDI